ncbi:MAG TPA: O-methyltransferase [Candidatus Acidoferrum sp.]
MSLNVWTEVDNYICGLLAPDDPALQAALKASEAAGLPAIQVSATQGKFLNLLARLIHANNILELGTLGGYSTIWLARALPPKGRVITVDANAKHTEVARANVAFAGLSDFVDFRVGPALDVLPEIEREGRGPFDFIFIDANKSNMPEYFDWALRLSRPGGLIIADNVIRDGKVIDAATADPDIQGVRRFNERLAAEKRVSATELQTVGSKGYDGFAMAVVLADA